MRTSRPAFAAMVLYLAGFGSSAQAALIPYTANGVSLVYDDDRNLTWLANANLFKTQWDADPTTPARIMAAVPSIDGHIIRANEFEFWHGRMTWWAAMAWAQWLGTIEYGGANDWRLWSALNADGSGPSFVVRNCADSEMGHLFCAEGGLNPTNLAFASNSVTSSFFNWHTESSYWSGQTASGYPSYAWMSQPFSAYQNYTTGKGVVELLGWAVRTGKISDAPAPGTLLLTALGLVGLGAGRAKSGTHGRKSLMIQSPSIL